MAENVSNEINLSPGPHFSAKRKTSTIMKMVCLSLLPECAAGIYYFGIPALITILVSVASCVLFEALFQILIHKKVSVLDFSAVVTGILLALTLPPSLPFWMTILGALFAVVVTKGFFGGLGSNVWNPALSGRAFLIMSFPVAMGSMWSKPGFDAITTATPLALGSPWAKNAADAVSSATQLANVIPSGSQSQFYWNLFIGNHGGCIGETCIAAIVISAIFLLATKIIDWRAPLAMVATCALATFLAGGDVVFTLLSGGLLFGAVFMVTDYTTSPVTKYGRLVFGAGCGLITFLIRQFGGYPEGVMFSILIMNSLVPFLNNLSTRKYGYGKKTPEKKGGKA